MEDREAIEAAERAVCAAFIISIWERRAGCWINIFSQDTPLTGQGVP